MSEVLTHRATKLVTRSSEMASERIGRLFDRYHLRLYGLARRMLSDSEEARDLVQEAFVRAARRPHSLPGDDGRAEAWLVRVVINLCRDRYRRLAVRRRPESERHLPPVAATDPESRAVAKATIEAALATLAPKRRAVIVLRELEDLPVAEVARLLAMNPGTVRWHHSTGRKELARRLRVEPTNKAQER